MITRKILPLLLIVFCSLQASASELIDTSNNPSASLKKLLMLTGVEHENNLPSIVDATQKQWLRGRNKERWEMDHKKFDSHQEAIKKIIFEEWKLDKPKHASKKHYKYALLLGCTGPCMRDRYDYLISEAKRGVNCDEWIFLVGDRPISPQVESPAALQKLVTQKLPDNIKTEADIARLLVKDTTLPVELKNTKITVLSSPMKKIGDGKLVRPNTGDTIHQWLQTKPQKGNVLFISSGIFVGYQSEVVNTIFNERKLNDDYHHETIGNKPHNDISVPVALDSIARELYQLKIKHEQG
jgi:hypothetical protein